MKLFDDTDLLVSAYFDTSANTRGYGVMMMLDKTDLSIVHYNFRTEGSAMFWVADFAISEPKGIMIAIVQNLLPSENLYYNGIGYRTSFTKHTVDTVGHTLTLTNNFSWNQSGGWDVCEGISIIDSQNEFYFTCVYHLNLLNSKALPMIVIFDTDTFALKGNFYMNFKLDSLTRDIYTRHIFA
jgi:hypothetical protein